MLLSCYWLYSNSSYTSIDQSICKIESALWKRNRRVTLSIRNMKTCCSHSETLTTLERWHRLEPPSHRPRKEVTKGAGRINEAPIKSAMHKCWIRMKWVERNLIQLCLILLMTQALALIDNRTNMANNVAWNGPFKMETGVANSSAPTITSIVSIISSIVRFACSSVPCCWITTDGPMSTFNGKLCRLPSSSSISLVGRLARQSRVKYSSRIDHTVLADEIGW